MKRRSFLACFGMAPILTPISVLSRPVEPSPIAPMQEVHVNVTGSAFDRHIQNLANQQCREALAIYGERNKRGL